MNKNKETVEGYIQAFSIEIAAKLEAIRQTIKNNAPQAEESIAYAMPAYKLNNKPLVYFAAFAKHIGFYATPTGHAKFKQQLAGYKQGKGSVQFPLEQDLPLDLIAEIVRFRVSENLEK